MILFGDREGKMSYLDLGPAEKWEQDREKYLPKCGSSIADLEDDDLDEPSTIHLLPNILIGTGKYCRSCKYHDKAVDTAHLTDNGYLITASAGMTRRNLI